LSQLRLFSGGGKSIEVKCRPPNAADKFPSILDERRLRRMWQDSVFLASTLPLSALQLAARTPIRFFTSGPASFFEFSGKITWNQKAAVMRPGDVSDIWWRPDKGVIVESNILVDVTGIPLPVWF